VNKKIILTSIISLLFLAVPASATLVIDSAINKAQKKITYDWEQSQSSFFVVPGIFLTVVGLALFFSRKK
jgi:hypothetical protein